MSKLLMRTQNDRLAHPRNPGSTTANSVTSLNKPTLVLKAHIMFHVLDVWSPPPHLSPPALPGPIFFSFMQCSKAAICDGLVHFSWMVWKRSFCDGLVHCLRFCYCTMLHLHQPIHSGVVYATVIIYYHQYFVPCCWLFVNTRQFTLFFTPFAAFYHR